MKQCRLATKQYRFLLLTLLLGLLLPYTQGVADTVTEPVRTLEGHLYKVSSLAFSPDGKYILSGSGDSAAGEGEIKLWEVNTGQEIRSFQKDNFAAEINLVSFTKDGRYAISVNDEANSKPSTEYFSVSSVKFWEVNTGLQPFEYRWEARHRLMKSLAVSPDGRYALSGLSASFKDTYHDYIRLWDVNTGEEIRTFSFPDRVGLGITSVAFSPDGLYALSSGGGMKLWEVNTGKEIRTFQGSDSVKAVAYSPDGRYALSGDSDNLMKLWEVDTGQELRAFQGHTQTVETVAYSPNGDYALSASEDKTVKFWEVNTGQEIRTFKHTEGGNLVAVSPDGNYAVSNDGKTLKLWDVSNTTPSITPPVTTTFPTLGENFTGGIAINSQLHQKGAILNLSDTVEVTGNITVKPADMGKTADIFVYAEATLPPSEDPLYFMLGEGLTISLWNKNPANLVAFQPKVTLSATQSVSMYSGKFVYPGTLKIYFGYRLPDGTLVANSNPINVSISSHGEPQFRGLVQVTPTDTDRVTLAWLPATDDDTSPEAMTYQVHLSDQPNFMPSTATLQTAVTGQEKTEVTGLATGQTYNVLVVAVDQDGNESVERDYRTAMTFADPVIVNPNTKTYVDTDVGLGTATTQDGVTFTYSNSGGVVPEVGSVLFSTVGDDMYLRKVTGVTPQGNGIVVQTTDAELAEVLAQATIDNTTTLFDVGEAADSTGSRTGVRTRQSLRADGSRYTVMEWPDKFLVATQVDVAGNDGEVSVSPGVRQNSSVIRIQRQSDSEDDNAEDDYDTKIETESEYSVTVEPTFGFEPELETTVVWKGDWFKGIQILGGKVVARGKLTAAIEAEFNFEASGSVRKKVPFSLFTRDYDSIYFVGGAVIQQHIKFTLDAELSATAAAKIQARSEAKATASLETGIRFNGTTGRWDILPLTPNFEKSFTASLTAHGEVIGEIRLIPNIEITFYGVAAAELSIEPFVTGKIAADFVSKADLLEQHGYAGMQLTNFDFWLQAQGFIGASLKMFTKKFPLLEKTQLFETPEWKLFSLPELEFAAESENSTEVGEPLELAVTVEDGANNPFNEASIEWLTVPQEASVAPKGCTGGVSDTDQPGGSGSGGGGGGGGGDSSEDSSKQKTCTVTFVPEKEGDYTVFFSGSNRLPDPFGRQFVLTEVSVGECGDKKPVASFTATPASGTAPLTVTLDASGSSDPDGFVVKYLWSSSDGQTAEGKSTSMTFSAAGTYTVNLTVEDETGCKGTVQKVVTVEGEKPKTAAHGIPDNTSTMQHGIPDNTSTMQHGIPDNTQTMSLTVKDRCYDGGPTGEWRGNYVTIKENGVEREVTDGEWIYGNNDGSFSVTTYSKGVQNGYSGSWKANCKPTGWHGNYVNNKRDGLWFWVTEYSDNGRFDTTTYVNGIKQGPSGQWNADGTARGCHGNYVADKPDGMWYCYNDKGKPSGWSGKYVNGKQDGLWVWVTEYSDNGRFDTTTYINGIKQGPSGQWNADGTARGCHGNYVADKPDGMWYCYNDKGKPSGWSGKYVNGKRDGLWVWVTEYSDNGRFDTTTYINGIKQGPSGQWNADGTARGCHGNYVADKPDGMWYCYNDKGKPSGWSGKYVNGKRDGLWVWVTEYSDNGRFDTTTYVNGIKQGPSGQWNADGTARGCHGNYVDDKLVGAWTCYKDDGTTYTETYMEGVKQ